jgi:hypothetical protein
MPCRLRVVGDIEICRKIALHQDLYHRPSFTQNCEAPVKFAWVLLGPFLRRIGVGQSNLYPGKH